jgi:hypothetical protein
VGVCVRWVNEFGGGELQFSVRYAVNKCGLTNYSSFLGVRVYSKLLRGRILCRCSLLQESGTTFHVYFMQSIVL